MAFKFFNVGKANAEIARLETELAATVAKLTTIEQEASTNTKDISEQAENLSAENKLLRSSISEFTAKIASKDQELAVANAARVAAEQAAATATASIAGAASAKALEIVASVGSKPVSNVPSANPAETKPEPKLTGLARVQAAFQAQLDQQAKLAAGK